MWTLLTILYKYNLEQNLYRILKTPFSIFFFYKFILKKYDTIPSKWRSIPAVLINSPSSQNDLLFNEKMLNQHLTQAKTTFSTQITRNTNKSSWKIIGERDNPPHHPHHPSTTNNEQLSLQYSKQGDVFLPTQNKYQFSF